MIKGNTAGKLDLSKDKLHKTYFLTIKPLTFLLESWYSLWTPSDQAANRSSFFSTSSI